MTLRHPRAPGGSDEGAAAEIVAGIKEATSELSGLRLSQRDDRTAGVDYGEAARDLLALTPRTKRLRPQERRRVSARAAGKATAEFARARDGVPSYEERLARALAQVLADRELDFRTTTPEPATPEGILRECRGIVGGIHRAFRDVLDAAEDRVTARALLQDQEQKHNKPKLDPVWDALPKPEDGALVSP